MGQFNGSGISNLPITFRGVSGSFIFLPPGIHSSSLDLEGTSSIEFTEKSASFILETSLNKDLQFRIPSRSVGTTQDIIPIYITSSGINPRVGIGTTNPLEALDFKDISDSVGGINLLLRSARTTIGAQIGDSAGLINFVIDSSSFIDVESSGSIASIQSQVSDIDFSGVIGELILSTAIGKSVGPIQRVKIGAVNTEITGTLKVSTDISSSGALHISGAESFIKTLRVGSPFPIGNNTLVASGPVSFIDSVTLGNSSIDKIAIEGMASITGSISASVDISASNTIFSKFITASLISASDKIDGSQILSKGNIVGLFHEGSSTTRLGTTGKKVAIYGNGISLQNSLTASAISASNIELTGNITASGNISSSGDLISNTLDTKTNKLAVTSTVHGNHQGDVVFFGGTTSMDVGQIYNLNGAGGWTKAQANSQANSDALLAVALGAASDTNGMLLKGMVTLDHDPGTIGDPLYLSDGAAGQATSTAPNSTNDIVRLIGYCVDSTNGQIYFNPSNDFIKHA
jgi:hypothetical protein